MPTLVKIIEKVRKAIKDNSLLKRGDTVCVAVSGGVDSTVLLHLLHALSGELGLRLVVCHLNHNLRGAEATRDKNFVKRLAKRLGLPFESAKLLKKDIRARSGQSVQEWARERRLDFLSSCADKYGTDSRPALIALGHNMDDQCETVLMRLVKGASLRGLAGIAWKRERFVRPVLGLSRMEIEAFAADNGMDFVEDSSNNSGKYLRNRIRHELIPALEGYNPRVREAVARSARLLREDEDCLSALAAVEFKKALLSRVSPKPRRGRKTSRRAAEELVFDRPALLALAPAVFRRVFTTAVYSLSTEAEPSLYLARIEAFRGLVKGRVPNTSLKLCDGLFAERAYDKITISTEAPEQLKGPAKDARKASTARASKTRSKRASKTRSNDEVVLPVPGRAGINGIDAVVTSTIIRRASVNLKAGEDAAYFDLDGLGGPLTLRAFRAGDRMRPMGMAGKKKLKDIFIDEKIPAQARRETLLVLCGGVIIWACGLRRSGLAPVTRTTEKALRLTLRQCG